jgi:hypothetical protein
MAGGGGGGNSVTELVDPVDRGVSYHKDAVARDHARAGGITVRSDPCDHYPALILGQGQALQALQLFGLGSSEALLSHRPVCGPQNRLQRHPVAGAEDVQCNRLIRRLQADLVA